MPNPYKEEEEDIVLLKVTEKEIEEAFPEKIKKMKIKLERERRK